MLVRDGTYREHIEVTSELHLFGRCAARVRIEGPTAQPTLFAHGSGASLDLRGVTVTGEGIGVEVEDGASVRAQSLAVLRCVREGVRVLGPSNFDASDIVIADTRPQGGGYGHGANINAAGSLRLTRASLLRNQSSGASSLGGALTVLDSIVSGTRVPPMGDSATGIYATQGSQTRVERVWITDNEDTGMTFVGDRTRATVIDVTVRGTHEFARTTALPNAVLVQNGATLDAARLLVSDNRGHGVNVQRGSDGAAGSIVHATLRDSVIRGPNSTSPDAQRVGLFAHPGSEVHAFGLHIRDAAHAGVIVTGDEARVSLDDTIIEGTRMNSAIPVPLLGCGVKVENGGRLTGRGLLVADNAWAGIFVGEPPRGSDRTVPDLVLEDAVVRGNHYDRQQGSGGGIMAQLGASVRLTRSRVTHNEGAGVVAIRATATIDDSVLEDTVTVRRVTDGGTVREEAQNLVAQDHATVTANGVRLRGGPGAIGALATGEGAVLTLRDSLAEGATGEDATRSVPCLLAELAGSITAEHVALRRCFGVAAQAQSLGASLSLTDALVQGTRSIQTPGAGVPLGRALDVADTASMALTRVLVEDNPECGVVAAGDRTTLSMSSVVLRDIRALPGMLYGQGLFAQEGASVTGARVVISATNSAGVFSTSGATVRLADSVISDVQALPMSGLANGMVAIDAELIAERVVVRHVFNSAVSSIWTNAPDTQPARVTVRDLIASDIRGDVNQLARGVIALGIGLHVLNGARLEGERVTLTDLTGVGVEASPAGPSVSDTPSTVQLTDLFLRNVRPPPTDGAMRNNQYGFALHVTQGASIELSRGLLDLGVWGFVLDRGAITAHHVVVSRQSQGLGMSSTTASDTRYTHDNVTSEGNLLNEMQYSQGAAEITVASQTTSCDSLRGCRTPAVPPR